MNRGAVETQKAFAAEGLSQNDAAKAVECDSGNFSKIMAGTRKPGRDLSARILKRFGVLIELWSEDVGGAQVEIDDAPPDSESKPDAKTGEDAA